MTDLQPIHFNTNVLAQGGYIIGTKIGKGSYTTVHLAYYRDPLTNKLIRLACKIFNIEKCPKRKYAEKFFPRELDILTKLEHPYIIETHSIVQQGPTTFIFMRYAENGNLLQFIMKNGVVMEQNAKQWFQQMASALQYLHSNEIVHRDLKCENILLSMRYNVKLADFGFARYIVDMDGHEVLSETYCGSFAYAAPEILSGTPYNPKLSDVWALGVILFVMLNGFFPFDDTNNHKLLLQQITRNWTFHPGVSDFLSWDAKDIVIRILEPDLTQRLSLDLIQSHSWMDQQLTQQASSAFSTVSSAFNLMASERDITLSHCQSSSCGQLMDYQIPNVLNSTKNVKLRPQ